jgi:DNA-directed RNA polymerase subunit RPC12/RpoP
MIVEAVVMEETPAAAPAAGPRESCLECGVDVTKRSRVQTCPDCGSLLCSAQCYREHRYHSHDKRKKKSRPREAECEFCGSNARPYVTTSISEAGWILFAILLVFFFPLCWLGLLMTETRLKCRDCGARLE